MHGLPGRSSRAIRAAHFLHRATRYAVHHRALVTRWIEGDVELLGKCGGDEANYKGGGYQQLLHNLLLGLVDALSAYGVVKPRLGKSNGSTICDYLRQKEAGRWVCRPVGKHKTRSPWREFEREGINVRFWHEADIPLALTNVRYRGVKRT